MAEYIKKPVVIQAFKLKEGIHTEEFPSWFTAALSNGVAKLYEDGTASINTLEGTHLANVGDFIIQGVEGELYPCKPGIFEKTYSLYSE